MKFFSRLEHKNVGRRGDFTPMTLVQQRLWWRGYWFGVFQAFAVLIITALIASILVYFSLHKKSSTLAFSGIAVFLSGLVTTPVTTYLGRKRYLRKELLAKKPNKK